MKRGISNPRNKLLFDNAKFILPYTGVGSGVVRALKSYDHITFNNDHITEEFVAIIRRSESNNNDSTAIDADNGGINDLINDPINDLINDPIKAKIIAMIKRKPNINYDELAIQTEVSISTVKRHIQQLKSKGIIERFGSKKTGGYRIKN
jgi:predicted HTH transcriptional regulator